MPVNEGSPKARCGPSQGTGSLLGISGPVLATLERCVVSGLKVKLFPRSLSIQVSGYQDPATTVPGQESAAFRDACFKRIRRTNRPYCTDRTNWFYDG